MVGVDGSPGADRALLWAADDAQRRHACLEVVLAWEAPVQIIGGAGWVIPNSETLAEYERQAWERLEGILAPHAAALERLDVRRSAIHGVPAAVLLAQAKDAVELVVGTRGRGDFVGLLLGSVSHQCAQHSPCPLVIVPRHAR